MKSLQYTKEEKIGIVTVNRPEALNALNRQLLLELQEFLDNVSDIDVLIVTGAGEKAFIAGADVKEMQTLSEGEREAFISLGQEVAFSLETVPFVTIAAVNGYALGGGLEMALGCDFIYASEKAKFGLPEVTLGIIPGFGGTQRLTDAVGVRKAKEMMMTGEAIGAKKAEEIGLCNMVVAHEELMEVCRDRAKMILKNSPFAVRQVKQVVELTKGIGTREGCLIEKERFLSCIVREDAKERMELFAARGRK